MPAKRGSRRRPIGPSRAAPAPRGSRAPQFEAIYAVIEPVPGRDGLALARQVARRAKLAGWTIEPVVEDATEIELLPPRRLAPGRAWDATYALRAEPEVAHAEPMFRYLVPENAERTRRKASGGGQTHDPATDTDFEWSLSKTRVLDAWRLFGQQPPGGGVRIGHPDTGYTLHPELAERPRILVSDGYDYEDDDADPLDDLDDGLLDNPGHGTGTGSVILSGIGSAAGGAGPFVSGVAPHALLIPIRTTESVVLLSMRALRQAIDHAADAGASIISISLGGPLPGFGTRRAIQRAIERGVIVLAAAGNKVRFVVFPAAFDEVIAVAATNIRDRPWDGSSRGRAVDISAPGESVWRATATDDGSSGMTFDVSRGNGTSFAVATAAGVAALWLSYHGSPALIRKYGAANLSRVFKQLLQATARRPPSWDASQYGAGIVNAKALLEAPLPPNVPARKLRTSGRAPVAADGTGLETVLHLFPDLPRTRVEAMLATLLNESEDSLPQILQDIGDEVVFQLVMDPRLFETAARTASGARGVKTASSGLRRRAALAPLSARLRRQIRR